MLQVTALRFGVAMAKMKCPGCGNRRAGPFCNVCGTALAVSEQTFRDQFIEAFNLRGLLTFVASTAVVIVAPVRMAQEWSGGTRDFSSPVKVFVGTILFTTLIVKLAMPAMLEWLRAMGAEPSFSTIAFQWEETLYPHFPQGFEQSFADPESHLLRVRQTQNLVGLPWQGLVSSLAVWWVFRRHRLLSLSKDQARAVALYVTSGTYLQGLIFVALSYALNSPFLFLVSGLYVMAAPLVGFNLAVFRIKSDERKDVSRLSILWRTVVACIVTLLLYAPVAFVCDIIALYPNPLLDALG